MKRKLFILAIFVCVLTAGAANAASNMPYAAVGKAAGAIVDPATGDTIYLATIRDLYVYPKMRFKNKKQEKFYWRTVRDVKKTLPYAKMLAREMERTDALMKQMTRKQQKKFWKDYEKLLFARYEDEFKRMTVSQGQMLMLLVDRECDRTSYDCIKLFRGSVTAMFWQGIAKMFGNDLKVEYDGNDKDKIVERVINLVEAGQL